MKIQALGPGFSVSLTVKSPGYLRTLYGHFLVVLPAESAVVHQIHDGSDQAEPAGEHKQDTHPDLIGQKALDTGQPHKSQQSHQQDGLGVFAPVGVYGIKLLGLIVIQFPKLQLKELEFFLVHAGKVPETVWIHIRMGLGVYRLAD